MATTLTIPVEHGAAADARAGKYLTFFLGNEEFGIRVANVREIMDVPEITSVPQTPLYMKGVINLRGKVTPVIDLRLKCGLPEIDHTKRTCIIVVEVDGVAAPMMIGVVVDGVSEVLQVAGADIEDTPDFGNGADLGYLLGMAKIKKKVVILLDIGQMLTVGELQGLGSML